MLLDGKVALITGAANGIGRATAEAFHAAGASVVLFDVDDSGAGVAARLGGNAYFVQGDVSDDQASAMAVSATAERFGGLDIVFNNAGVAATGEIEDVTPQMFDRTIGVNLRGPYLITRAALPCLRRRGGGVVLMNASNSGLVARAHDPIYGATKAGLLQLTRSLALAVARDGIRVNAICPGPVESATLRRETDDLEPGDRLHVLLASVPLGRALGRIAQPEEIAQAALFLCSDAAAYITGIALPVDGGKTAGLQLGVPSAAPIAAPD